jgi:hypothetical protein
MSDYTITVYDASGKVVGTDQNVTALGPGEARWLVAGQIATGTDAVARADLQLRPTKAWRPAASWPAPELTVSQATYRDDRFSPRVVGQVTHEGTTTPLSQVQITTVHWDAQGNLVATGQGFVSSVAPGQTVSFEATPVVRGEAPVAKTETQAAAVLVPGLY